METPIDKKKLLQCLVNLSMNSNPGIIHESNSNIMEMEGNQNFLVILLELFEEESNFNLKCQIFLVFKSCFSRKLCSPKFKSGEESLKNQIKQKLLDYMQHFKGAPFLLKHVQSAILDAVETDFPLNYKALLQYLINGFRIISDEMAANPMFLFENQAMRFMKEAKKIFKRKSKSKNCPKLNENSFREFFENILQSLFSIINLINENFETTIINQPLETVSKYLNVSLMSDEIILMILEYIHPEAPFQHIVSSITNKMFQKSTLIIQILLKNSKIDSEIKGLINKNFKGILFNLSNLQYSLPIMFFSCLGEYTNLIKFIIDNNASFTNEKILKCSLVCFWKLLKTFVYFSDSQTYSKSIKKNDKSFEQKMQEHAFVTQNISSLFQEDLIETYLFSFLQNILIKEFNKQKNEENYENLIEIEMESGLDDISNELENSVYSLTMVTLEMFMIRFPNVCFVKINNLTNQLISSNSDSIEKPIQDGIFAILGIIPKAFTKLKIEKNPSELIDILKVLEFIKNNISKDALYARRFAALTMRWMNVLSDNVLMTTSELIYQILINFNNPLIQYESMKCLHEIIKFKNIPLNYSDIVLNTVPILINIIEKFNNPIIISPLFDFLNVLLEKTQNSPTHVVTTLLQNPFFRKLIQNDSEILRNAICEMFKSLIFSFAGTNHINVIYNVVIEFIDQSFHIYNQNKEKYEGGILRLWLIMIKEYQLSQEETVIFQALKQLFQKYLKKILLWNQECDMEIIAEILEENYLLGFEQNSDNFLWLIKFIEDKYEFSNQMSHEDSTALLKISILSLIASFILKLNNEKKEFDFNIFEKVITLILLDVMRPQFLCKSKKYHGFRTSLVTMVNRFLIKYPMNIFQILHNHGKTEEFVACWIYSMKEISSGNACKISLIAVFSNISFIEKTQFFFNQFDNFIENLLLNFTFCLKHDMAENNKTKSLNLNAKNENSISKRKEMIRKTNLFDEYDIKTLFSAGIKDLLYGKNYKDLIKNPDILNKFLSINV